MSSLLCSLVIPLLDEEANVEELVLGLIRSFEAASLRYELILVDNGSRDRTGTIIDDLAAASRSIRKVVVPKNEGYGNGILAGMREARGDYVGFMPGDRQVSGEEVAKVLAKAAAGTHDFVKAARDTRLDSLKRRLLSYGLNKTATLLFRLPVRDVNGTPKLLSRSLLNRITLRDKKWFIDAEMLIKTSRIAGCRFLEVPVVFRPRCQGRSRVRCLSASIEILVEMLRYRLARDSARARIPGGATLQRP